MVYWAQSGLPVSGWVRKLPPQLSPPAVISRNVASIPARPAVHTADTTADPVGSSKPASDTSSLSRATNAITLGGNCGNALDPVVRRHGRQAGEGPHAQTLRVHPPTAKPKRYRARHERAMGPSAAMHKYAACCHAADGSQNCRRR